MDFFSSRSAAVDHVVGYFSVVLRGGVGFGVGGRHIWVAYGEGAISLTAIGRSHFWGTAAKSKCIHAHWLGWSLVLLVSLLPGG